MDLSQEALLSMASDAGELATERPDPALWRTLANGVVTAGGGAPRHPDWSRTEPAGITPLDAFIDTAADFGALVDSLDPDEWRRRTRIEGTVIRDLVQHLVGMERYLLGQLDRGPVHIADRKADHWPVTTAAASDMSDLPDDAVARAWWHEALRFIAACSELGSHHPVRYHHLAGNVRSLLVSRTFELWTHGDDVRQAVGRDLDLLDDARLSLMVGELMQAVPIGMALTGQSAPGRSVRFVLAGPGGGVFDEPLTLGEAAGPADVTISTDTIGLCRLAANRLSVNELGPVVEGDRTLAEPVLVALTAFAAD